MKPALPYLPTRTITKPSASAPDWEEARKRKLPCSNSSNIARLPVVVDADALNILANHRHTLTHLPKGSILTPHPKELERLTGKCQDSYERLTKACELAHAANVHIILKGAYSAIITPAGKCYFNPTGNPGMATGGSGDVLTGVILALLAQGYPAEDAAKIGTYIHGLAGDFAQKKQGMIGLIASDIITCLPTAWRLVSE